MSAEDDARPVKKAQPIADENRRAALRKLGKVATYGVPVTLSLMSIRHAAAAS
ncbi:hypothetical protein [Ancylobacter rudongensis]|uniref:Uncharacterized protein n=1 Tax=Ancylobacter rudongensis TaxID=177413 RepID=A0A1G4SID4_9HYPH|nr:hypothetical protein [Ancylobacter rudongensis]SCW68943.1 hypothetical protein SAMN05660859_2241 [Ancylobacter rudongensis]